MPYQSKNQLTIEPVYAADGSGRIISYRMFGYILGEKVRLRRTSLAELEKLYQGYMAKVADSRAMQQMRPVATFLTEDKVRMYEAIDREFRAFPRPILEYARAGLGVLGAGARTEARAAVQLWADYNEHELMLEKRSRDDNEREALKLIEFSKVKYLDQLTAAHIEAYGSLGRIRAKREGKKPSMNTKLGKLARIRTWLNFCARRKLIAVSPFAADVKALRAQAKKERPRILTPEQAGALLDAALEHDARYVPYVILSTWCMMRSAEAERTTPKELHLDRRVPVVEILPEKNGTDPRTTEIPKNILPLLRACVDAGLWHPRYADNKSIPEQTAWKTIRHKAGLIELGERNEKGYRKVIGGIWQENIARHTGISYLYQRYSDEAAAGRFQHTSVIASVTQQAGNSGDVAFEFYIHLPKEGDADRFYAVERKLGELPDWLKGELAKKEVAQSPAQSAA